MMPTKTTIEIRERLLDAARDLARLEKISLSALIEEGLELAIERRTERDPFTLRDESFGGNGVQPGVREGEWSGIWR